MIELVSTVDYTVNQFLFLHRLPELVAFFKFITLFGNGIVIITIGISMAIVLIRHGRWSYLAGLAIAIIGAPITSYLLKLLVERDRPLPPFALLDLGSYSFPSLHATMAIALYGFLTYLVWKLLRPPHHRVPWVIFFSLLAILVGFSRMYLGVHYTSDVVAGFLIGSFFVTLAIFVTKRLTTALK